MQGWHQIPKHGIVMFDNFINKSVASAVKELFKG